MNPYKTIVALLFFLGLGALMGGMYTKIKFLEAGYGGSVQSAQTAPIPTNPSVPTTPTAPQPTKVDVKVGSNDPFKGNANAKLTVVEFGDYQCPFCGRFFKEVEPQIIKDYVDIGKIKFVYKNLAFLGQESKDAANAALCAKEQNKFWEYHDKLYNSQNGENQGAFSIENLKKFAAGLGLNSTKFNSCLDTGKFNAQVQEDVAEASKNGFQGTPSTAVGTVGVVGAQPYAQFKSKIDAELAKL